MGENLRGMSSLGRGTVATGGGISFSFSAPTAGVAARTRAGARTNSPASGAEARKAALRRLPLFHNIPDLQLQALAEASRTTRLPRGASLPHSGLSRDCVVLMSGLVRTMVPREHIDGELMLDLLGAGDIVSDGCWLERAWETSVASVAAEESSALLIPRREFLELWTSSAVLAEQFLNLSASRHARLSSLAIQNACLDVGDRLYCRLVELAYRRGRVTPEGLVVEHGLTQREVAAFAVASRENVNRQLGKWQDDGWIVVRRRAVVILQADALSRSVSPMARRVGFGVGDGRCTFGTA